MIIDDWLKYLFLALGYQFDPYYFVVVCPFLFLCHKIIIMVKAQSTRLDWNSYPGFMIKKTVMLWCTGTCTYCTVQCEEWVCHSGLTCTHVPCKTRSNTSSSLLLLAHHHKLHHIPLVDEIQIFLFYNMCCLLLFVPHLLVPSIITTINISTIIYLITLHLTIPMPCNQPTHKFTSTD